MAIFILKISVLFEDRSPHATLNYSHHRKLSFFLSTHTMHMCKGLSVKLELRLESFHDEVKRQVQQGTFSFQMELDPGGDRCTQSISTMK